MYLYILKFPKVEVHILKFWIKKTIYTSFENNAFILQLLDHFKKLRQLIDYKIIEFDLNFPFYLLLVAIKKKNVRRKIICC